MKGVFTFLLCFATVTACAQRVDSLRLMNDLRELSSDKYEGRKPGTYGGRLAQYFLVNRYKDIGLETYYPGYKQGIVVLGNKIDHHGPDSVWNFEQVKGANVIGYIPGRQKEIIVISAHFDHVGIAKGQIFNGADDNASGVAALLSIAEYFKKNPPQHTLIFAAFDAEELFMLGAVGFVENLPVPREDIILNVNMDMIGTNTNNQMFAGGTRYTSELMPILRKVWARRKGISIVFGFDNSHMKDDRTYRSDHGVFHLVGIPFLYFGVPKHPNYHQPTDDYENISHPFYYSGVNLILQSVVELDRGFVGVKRRIRD